MHPLAPSIDGKSFSQTQQKKSSSPSIPFFGSRFDETRQTELQADIRVVYLGGKNEDRHFLSICIQEKRRTGAQKMFDRRRKKTDLTAKDFQFQQNNYQRYSSFFARVILQPLPPICLPFPALLPLLA
jgi:hypothetical protein